MFVLIIQSCYYYLTMENVKIADICGLCAGCKNAIDTATKLSQTKNVTLFKEIVHNKNVNQKLCNLGISIIDNLEQLQAGSHLVLRAHGEPPATYEFLEANNINYSDCTCNNVKKIHEQVLHFSEQGYKIVIIGKYGKQNNKLHPEVFGTIGWCQNEPILIEDEEDVFKLDKFQKDKFYLICQTTFNENKADELINKITKICSKTNSKLIVNKSICFAQKSINISSINLAKTCDIMIVVGGKNSSNSLELFYNVNNHTPSIFIEDITTWKDELTKQKLIYNNKTKFGITAGASTLKEELTKLKQLIANELKRLA